MLKKDNPMTIEEFEMRVKEIDQSRGDSEGAHDLEDCLYTDFVKYIAKTGDKEQCRMAKAILETKKIKFARWTA